MQIPGYLLFAYPASVHPESVCYLPGDSSTVKWGEPWAGESAGHSVSSVLIYLKVNSDVGFPEQDVAYLKGPGEWQGALTAGLCQSRKDSFKSSWG